MAFGSYASNHSDWNFRKWILPMLVLSLAMHLCLMMAFEAKKLREFAPVQKERLIPRAFNMKRAEIDPRILQNTNVPKTQDLTPQPLPEVTKINLASPKKAFDASLAEIRVAPAAADLTKPLLNEKPKVDPAAVNAAMSQMEARSSHALEREMDTLRQELAAQKPASINQPALTAQGLVDSSADPVDAPLDIASRLKGEKSEKSEKGEKSENAGPDADTPGFSNLDDLLSQTGPLPSDTRPLNFKGDTLFSYDSFVLSDDAISSMTKLGQLIQKNPQATFIIEGYTDSFGSPTYNQQLSVNRAESVKAWLVQNMNIDAARVQTRGYGSSRLLVPVMQNGRPTSVEEQQLNRRVEIVIRTR